jgi:Lar family restriction alleviation protein
MPELKPCPFCGNKKVGIQIYFDAVREYVCCYKCYASGPLKQTGKAAIAAWNKRVKEGEE